ncbi:zinc-binding dehydrogenase [Halosimplex amylolyticum]|uniref:zinc-dependent alcohol dehydrogenase n=1 Tax=Halosimplex amylolyticum TaxID=3396616 RepID=UPI003F56554C
MRTNDTVVFADANEVTVEERPVPEPDAGQVLIEAERSLISTGTELTQLSGDVPEGSVWDQISNYPIDTPGYCTTGEIVAVGEGVDESVIGDRVATWKHHARYTVADYDAVEPVPDGVSAEEAAFTPIVQIVMNGVRHGDLDWGESVGIYGLGLLGQLATRFVRMAGTRPVYALDLAEERIEYLPEDSAVEVINPAEDDPRARVESTGHGRLADVVFEVTGNPDVITQEFDILREQGRLVMLSSPKGETSFDFHDYCNRGSYEIVGAHVNSHPTVETPANPWTKARNAELFYDLLLDDRLDVTDLISHRESIEDAPSTYDMLVEDRTRAMGVIFEW